MDETTLSPGGWSTILHVCAVNLVLSGDNAVVIALAASRLEARQRRQAVVWGTSLAILLRVILTSLATYLVVLPGLMILGGVVLYCIAVKLLVEDVGDEPDGDPAGGTAPHRLAVAVRTICVADLAMSLDNVLAVAGASGGQQTSMIVGLVISVCCIVLLGGLVADLMSRYRWLVYAGAAILAYTSVEMIVTSRELDRVVNYVAERLGDSHLLATWSWPRGWWQWPLQLLAIGICLGLGYARRRDLREADELTPSAEAAD